MENEVKEAAPRLDDISPGEYLETSLLNSVEFSIGLPGIHAGLKFEL